MFSQGPSEKVKFLAMGELPSPGSCFICGNGTNEDGYVDTGVWLEYIGEGLICHTCVIQVGECIGMMIPDEVKFINDAMANLATENARLERDNGVLNERLTAYDTVIGNSLSAVDFSNLPTVPAGDEARNSADEASGSGESETSESVVSDGGPTDFGAPESNYGDSAGAEPLIRL
jgi:hypothetical protein